MVSPAPTAFPLRRRTALAFGAATLFCATGAQAGPAASGSPPPNASDTDSVVVSSDPPKHPHKHRKMARGPVKPETFPTKPQRAVTGPANR